MSFTYKDEKSAIIDLGYYQRLLRLMDWQVTLHFNVPLAEVPVADSSAAMQWNIHHKLGHLYLLDPKEYPTDTWGEQDQEVDLVHELLHLLYAPFDTTETGSVADAFLEFSINTISTALVKERRRANDFSKKYQMLRLEVPRNE